MLYIIIAKIALALVHTYVTRQCRISFGTVVYNGIINEYISIHDVRINVGCYDQKIHASLLTWIQHVKHKLSFHWWDFRS